MRKAERHASRLLDRADLEGRISNVALRMFGQGHGKRHLDRVGAVAREWVAQQGKVRYGTTFDVLRPSDQAVADATDIGAALFLLLNKEGGPLPATAPEDAERLGRFLSGLEPGFVDELLAGIRLRERSHAAFSEDIAQARRWVVATANSMRRALRADAAASTEVDNPIEGANELDIVFRQANEDAIGIFVIVLVAAAVAVWYFYERSKLKEEDEDDEDEPA
jgi:hypothetical protein